MRLVPTEKLKFKGSFLALLVWPAVVSWVLKNIEADPIGEFLRAWFYYPDSLKNITEHWLKSEPVYKSVYINCWYINSYFIGGGLIFASIRDPERFQRSLSSYPGLEAGARKWWKWFALSVGLLVFFVAGYSSIMFDPNRPLGMKSEFVLASDFGFYFLLALFYPFVASSGVGACLAFVEGVKSFGRKGNRNE